MAMAPVWVYRHKRRQTARRTWNANSMKRSP